MWWYFVKDFIYIFLIANDTFMCWSAFCVSPLLEKFAYVFCSFFNFYFPWVSEFWKFSLFADVHLLQHLLLAALLLTAFPLLSKGGHVSGVCCSVELCVCTTRPWLLQPPGSLSTEEMLSSSSELLRVVFSSLLVALPFHINCQWCRIDLQNKFHCGHW